MRKELKNFNWHIYGLRVSDFDYTLNLVRDVIRDRKYKLETKIAEYDNVEDVEIVADICHYNYIENQYLWSFALWRTQGVFEGILKQEYFPNKHVGNGLSNKVKYCKKKGFNISDSNFNKILEWSELRNSLSLFLLNNTDR